MFTPPSCVFYELKVVILVYCVLIINMVLRRGGIENHLMSTNLEAAATSPPPPPPSILFNLENEANFGEGKSPLGLTLRKTQSLLDLIEARLAEAAASDQQQQQKKNHNFISPSEKEKLKASNFPATLLKIGSWERSSRHEGDLIAKLYYAKKKLVWEVLEGALKSKIEVQWSDIAGIRADIRDNENGTLEIELNHPPTFFRETNPQPRKHTLWQQASDFTGGQAPICRVHWVVFPPGTLDKHYEKLLQCDQRLFDLSQQPFPTYAQTYFLPDPYGFQDFPGHFNGGFPQFSHVAPQHNYPTIQNFPITTTYPPRVNFVEPTHHQHLGAVNLSSPMSDESGNNYPYDNHQGPVVWGNQGGNINQLQGFPSPSMTMHVNPTLPCQDYGMMSYGDHESGMNYSNTGFQIDDIKNHLLGDSQVVCQDEMSLLERVSSMSSLLQPAPQEGANPEGVYTQPISWSSVQLPNANFRSAAAYQQHMFPEPTMEDYAALDASQEIHHWS